MKDRKSLPEMVAVWAVSLGISAVMMCAWRESDPSIEDDFQDVRVAHATEITAGNTVAQQDEGTVAGQDNNAAAEQDGGTVDTVSVVPMVDIVKADHQMYTYPEMTEDILLLQQTYPDFIHVDVAGYSAEGRAIPMVSLGNTGADKQIMVQSSMHAREYMATELTMEMIEYYAGLYTANSLYLDRTMQDLFSRVCIRIIPMANPDGVCLSQFGVGGVQRESARQFWGTRYKPGQLVQLKANANGVDLNRNFPMGWNQAEVYSTTCNDSPCLFFYKGPYPGSEPETQCLMNVAQTYPFVMHLNYHTCGNVVYCGSSGITEALHQKIDLMYQLIRINNGYRGIDSYNGDNGINESTGTFADWLCLVLQRPSCTIELGTRNPVPQTEFPELYEKNKNVWATLMYFICGGSF